MALPYDILQGKTSQECIFEDLSRYPHSLVSSDPVSVARQYGIRFINDPCVDNGYVIERAPLDPVIERSSEIEPFQLLVRACTREGCVSAAVHILGEMVAPTQFSRHSSELKKASTSQICLSDMSEVDKQELFKKVSIGHFTPRLEHRALHVDAGRKFFPPAYLHDLLRLMAWSRLNVMNLHFSEVHGYRLESLFHPEIVADEYLTIADIKLLQDHAAQLGIRIIPSFDMPGHLDGLLKNHTWAQLPRDDGKTFPGALDITNEKACQLVWEVLDEVISIFDTREVTIGGDEFLDFGTGVKCLRSKAHELFGDQAQEADVWIHFLNRTIERLDAKGIQAGVYNDGVHKHRIVNLDKRAIVHYWTRWGSHMASPVDFDSNGYRLINWDGGSLYFVLLETYKNCQPTFDSVWAEFDPFFYPDKVSSSYCAHTQGCCFSIWCDKPDYMDCEHIVRAVQEPLIAFGARAWPIGRLTTPRRIQAISTLI